MPLIATLSIVDRVTKLIAFIAFTLLSWQCFSEIKLTVSPVYMAIEIPCPPSDDAQVDYCIEYFASPDRLEGLTIQGERVHSIGELRHHLAEDKKLRQEASIWGLYPMPFIDQANRKYMIFIKASTRDEIKSLSIKELRELRIKHNLEIYVEKVSYLGQEHFREVRSLVETVQGDIVANK